MGGLAAAEKQLDLVYISHIDQDHICGVLKMLDDEAAWRVHEFQINRNSNKGKHAKPKAPRPPENIGKLYHNSFHDQVGENSGEIESMLAATSL